MNGLHLAALSAFALAQPLFDVLEYEPAFFTARGSDGLEIVLFALAVTLVPPALLLAVEAVVWLVRPQLGRALHLLIVALLCAAIAVPVAKRLGVASAGVVLASGALLGVGAAALYWRRQEARSLVSVLAVAPLLFLVLFLFFSPVGELTLGGEAKSRAARVASDVPVVMVVLDEFPLASLLNSRNRIDSARYPAFAELARDATWFRNAAGVHDHTTRAVPAVLDGRTPLGDARTLPTASDHPDNLFTLFGSSYSMNVVEHVTALCPRSICRRARLDATFARRMRGLLSDAGVVYGHIALPDALASGLPSASESYAHFGDEGTKQAVAARQIPARRAAAPAPDGGPGPAPVKAGRPNRTQRWEAMIRRRATKIYGARAAEFVSWVASIRNTPKPSFSFHHLLLPHGPFVYLPSGQRYVVGTKDELTGLDGRVPRDEFLARHGYQRHMLQVAFTDRLLGALLRRLHRQRLYDKALIALTADHGAVFRRGVDRRYVNRKVVADIASVPLLIKPPGQRGGAINDAYVRTSDIPATIADLLDIPLSWSSDGRSGFSAAVAKRRTVVVRNRRGHAFRLSAAEYERRQARMLRRKLSLFGEGTAGAGLYGGGPNRALIGRRPGRFGVARAGRLKARIDRASRLRRVDLGSGFLPALVHGRISGGSSRARRALAFALNGRIVATGRSFSLRLEKGELFAALLPVSAFRRGRNRLAVYAAVRAPGGLRLRLLGRT